MAEASPTQGRIHAAISSQLPLIATILFDHRRETFVGASLIAVTLYAILMVFGAVHINQPETFGGTIFGGDFVVFWTAAKSVFAENLASIYNAGIFEERLAEKFPNGDSFNVSWQYPPTMFLIVAPFAALPYLPALIAWWATNLALFAGVMRMLWRDGSALLIALASTAVFQGMITGQTGFLTASLLALAAFKPATAPHPRRSCRGRSYHQTAIRLTYSHRLYCGGLLARFWRGGDYRDMPRNIQRGRLWGRYLAGVVRCDHGP